MRGSPAGQPGTQLNPRGCYCLKDMGGEGETNYSEVSFILETRQNIFFRERGIKVNSGTYILKNVPSFPAFLFSSFSYFF